MVSLVPSWLSVTKMRLPVDKSENKNKILELVIDLELSRKEERAKSA